MEWDGVVGDPLAIPVFNTPAHDMSPGSQAR